MNPCCPVGISACVSLSKVGDLCGAIDPDDDPDAKRPTAYQNVTYSTTSSGGYDGSGGVNPCDFGAVAKVQRSGSYSSNTTTIKEYSVNEEGGCESEVISTTILGSSSYNRTETCCGCCGGCPTTQFSCSSSQSEDGTWTGSTTTTFFDGEETTTTTEPNDGLCPSNYSNPGEETIDFSSADTESAALSRVDEWTQGSSCTSSNYRVSAYNTGDKLGVSKTTVKHEAVATGLVIGFCYEGAIPIYRASIEFNEDGTRISPVEEDWELWSYIFIDEFRAARVFQTFGGGTLNIGNQSFIDASFSLDPYDYPAYFPVNPETGILIDPDALVLTPFSALPISKIYDYRVLPIIMRRVECAEE